MQTDAKHPIGKVQSYAARNTAWAQIKAILRHNEELGDKVLWCWGVDWQRTRHKFQGYKRLDKLFHAILCWELWAVMQYRFSYWAHNRALPEFGRRRFLRQLLFLQQAALLRFCYLIGKFVEGLSGARLAVDAEIGPGLLLVHTGSCGIGRGTKIGCNFTMYQDANIMPGHDHSSATIGDNVTLYTGARIIGAVHVGDGVRVGSNAVVTHDLPASCLALGAPARAVRAGDSSPRRAASRQVADLLVTLVEAGELEALEHNRYRDVSTGIRFNIIYDSDGEREQR